MLDGPGGAMIDACTRLGNVPPWLAVTFRAAGTSLVPSMTIARYLPRASSGSIAPSNRMPSAYSRVKSMLP